MNRVTSGPLIIHTNAPVRYQFYWEDEDGVPADIPAGEYKAQVKKHRYDAPVVLEFRSSGGTGLGTLTRTGAGSGADYDTLDFFCSQLLVANVAPGAYYIDILRIDTPRWVTELDCLVVHGVTDPAADFTPTLPGAVTQRQYRLALAQQGMLHLVTQAIPADADDPANIHWDVGYPVVLGDPLTTVTQAALGYSDNEMIDLMLLAGTF